MCVHACVCVNACVSLTVELVDLLLGSDEHLFGLVLLVSQLLPQFLLLTASLPHLLPQPSQLLQHLLTGLGGLASRVSLLVSLASLVSLLVSLVSLLVSLVSLIQSFL